MDILEAKQLTKTFGKFKAVDNISFSLKEGEILGFLGRNGAGKTTTLQMLLTILTPTSGEISYFGKNLKDYREEIMEQVNFSSTYTNLPWTLTVKENLTFLSYLYKIENRKERIAKIIGQFGLEELFNLKISALSSGQLTKVNLAKAFLNYPKVLLLDEPTASLDPEIAVDVRKFLLQQRQNFKVSIIITSHNMAEVEELCDRVIVIDKGKLIVNNTPDILAKTIEISHLDLMIKDGLKRVISYCENEKISYKIDGRRIVVDIRHKDIPDFLRTLMTRGIYYEEISIEKPNLEDYFLNLISK